MKAADLVNKLSKVHPDTRVLFNSGYHPVGKAHQYSDYVSVREEQAIQLSEGEFDFLSNHFDVQDMEEQYLREGDDVLSFFNVLVIEEA